MDSAIASSAPAAAAPERPRNLLRAVLADIGDDRVPSLAASLAYTMTLSLSPLVLLSLAFLGTIHPALQEKFIAEVGALVGSEGATVVRSIVESADERPDLRQAAGWTGLAVLLFGASAIFGQLQSALNGIWDMENRALSGAWGFVRRRVLSAGVLLAILFLTIVSFLVQAALAGMPFVAEDSLEAVWWLVSLMIYSALFAALYRWLPDRRIPWGTAIRGGLLTTLLFLVGRWGIGVYLGHSDTAGAFGPAGALVVWLIWSYYTALVFLVSAELVYELAHRRGWGWWQPTTSGRRGGAPVARG